jgi:hypothetical protein
MIRPQAPSRHIGRPLLLGALLATILVAVGCGVDFSQETEESEILKALAITGDFTPNGALLLTLDYEQPYPALINVSCDVLENRAGKRADRLVANIMEKPLIVNDEGGPLPEATPIAESIEQEFQAPATPGSYEVNCYTVGEEDNDIERMITIAGEAPEGTPSS